MGADLLVLDHDRADHRIERRRIQRGGIARPHTVGFPKLLPGLPFGVLPAFGPRIGCRGTTDVDLDPADLEIAGAGDGRDAALALDLGEDRRARNQARKPQRGAPASRTAARRKGRNGNIGRKAAKRTPVERPDFQASS
jgi:hypothetical protein